MKENKDKERERPKGDEEGTRRLLDEMMAREKSPAPAPVPEGEAANPFKSSVWRRVTLLQQEADGCSKLHEAMATDWVKTLIPLQKLLEEFNGQVDQIMMEILQLESVEKDLPQNPEKLDHYNEKNGNILGMCNDLEQKRCEELSTFVDAALTLSHAHYENGDEKL